MDRRRLRDYIEAPGICSDVFPIDKERAWKDIEALLEHYYPDWERLGIERDGPDIAIDFNDFISYIILYSELATGRLEAVGTRYDLEDNEVKLVYIDDKVYRCVELSDEEIGDLE